MSARPDESSLIAACRAGKTEAYGVLVERYQGRLYPTIFRLTGCAEEASDVLQEAFFQAYRKLDRFQGGSSFYTWIYRIAINLALSARRRSRDRRRTEDWETRAASRLVRPRSLGFDPPDPRTSIDPSIRLQEVERDQQVQQALDRLAPEHRAVVVLKEFDGLRYDEISVILNVPIGTVRSRLHRARVELRQLLAPLFDVAEGDPATSPDSEPAPLRSRFGSSSQAEIP